MTGARQGEWCRVLAVSPALRHSEGRQIAHQNSLGRPTWSSRGSCRHDSKNAIRKDNDKGQLGTLTTISDDYVAEQLLANRDGRIRCECHAACGDHIIGSLLGAQAGLPGVEGNPQR